MLQENCKLSGMPLSITYLYMYIAINLLSSRYQHMNDSERIFTILEANVTM